MPGRISHAESTRFLKFSKYRGYRYSRTFFSKMYIRLLYINLYCSKFPCECGNMLWKTRRFNMQLLDDAYSWCRWPCSMRGLPRLLSTSWATENAVLALFLDPLLLGRWLQHAARYPGRLPGALRCSAWWTRAKHWPLAFSANGPFLKRFSVSLSDSLPVSKHPP